MTDFFIKNLEQIKKFHPQTYKAIAGTTCAEKSKTPFEVLPTADGSYTLRIAGRKNFFLNSRYSPFKEAQRFANGHYDPEISVFVLYGFGLGYHVMELLGRMSIGQKLHVIDLSPWIFRVALKLRDMSGILEDRRLTLWISGDAEQIFSAFGSLLGEKNMKLILHRPSVRCIEEVHNAFWFALENASIRMNSFERFKEAMQENMVKNSLLIKDNVGIFFNKYRNIPIFIVSAGPSLDKNIHLLHGIQNKAVILAVGRALRPLINRGIRPDFFVITDPQEIVREQLKGLEDLDIPGLFLMTACHSAARDYSGPKYLIVQEPEHLPEGKMDFLVETGGSVATTALDLAIKMGGNPIVFVGQDLAYSEGRHHAAGTLYENENETAAHDIGRRLMTKGWHGGEVPTSMSFLSFRKWMEDRIKRERDRTFVNATEGGAFIEGCRHIMLESVIREYIR